MSMIDNDFDIFEMDPAIYTEQLDCIDTNEEQSFVIRITLRDASTLLKITNVCNADGSEPYITKMDNTPWEDAAFTEKTGFGYKTVFNIAFWYVIN